MKKLNRPMVFILSAAMAGTLMHVPVYAEESMTSEETLRVTEETNDEQTETTVTVETTETTAESVEDASAIETAVKSETETEKIQEETVDEETLKEAGDPVEAFVSRLYSVILNRNPDSAGLKAWAEVLKSGREQGAKVAQGFVDSPEMKARNLSDDAYIRALYRAFFDREADAGGLEAWKSVLNSGLSRLHVFKGFAESNEFTGICSKYGIVRGYANLTEPRDQNEGITKFIYRCYDKFLGRKADVTGLNAWAEELLSGRSNAKEVAYGFVMSNEFQKKGLGHSDYVRTLYQGLFNRNADSVGLAQWVEKLNLGNTRESIFYGFGDSQEFRSLARSFGLDGGWQGTPVDYIGEAAPGWHTESLSGDASKYITLYIPDSWNGKYVIKQSTNADGEMYISIHSKLNYDRGYDGELTTICISKQSILDWEGDWPYAYIGTSGLGVVYSIEVSDVRFDGSNQACMDEYMFLENDIDTVLNSIKCR